VQCSYAAKFFIPQSPLALALKRCEQGEALSAQHHQQPDASVNTRCATYSQKLRRLTGNKLKPGFFNLESTSL